MHERISVNSLCFRGADLEAMACHWRALNPRRISVAGEILPADLSVPSKIIADGRYRLEAVVHRFLQESHLDAPEEVVSAEQDLLRRRIDVVAELGGRSIYMLTGGHGRLAWDAAARRFAEAVAPGLAHAKAAGVRLMIEPAPAVYADSHIAHSLRDTLALAEIAGLDVCIDLYSSWAEGGLKETIERAVPRCGLVQLADYVYGDRAIPGRAVPGDGDIPLQRLFDWLLSAGYAGAFDLEIIGPRIDAEGRLSATRRAADRVGEYLSALGA